MSLRRRFALIGIVSLPLLLAAIAIVSALVLRQGGLEPFDVPSASSEQPASGPTLVEQGRYLARVGNCGGCHTARGGEPFAGGRAFATGYGTVYSSNLTPDPQHGIGDWSLQEFRHAMRHGVSRNGVQSPVFPYANFAHLDDAELDALFAYLRMQPAIAKAPPDDDFSFPANLPGAMTAWRLLNYRPVALPDAATQSGAWQRGRRLVNGVGHCAMCHGARGSLATLSDESFLAGNRLRGWYAPPLNSVALDDFANGQLARYLRTGVSSHSAAYGNMADVVFENLQHLTPPDAAAIETYLASLPAPAPVPQRRHRIDAPADRIARGDRLYEKHCADCHGDDGLGEPDKYPSLVGSAAITADDPINLVKLILFGGSAPTTAANPQPYTMPPFAQQLSNEDVAMLVNALRQRWGSPMQPVTPQDVNLLGGIEQR